MGDWGEYRDEDLHWIVGRDHLEREIGRFGVPADVILGTARHIDGWSVAYSTVAIEINGERGIAPMPAVLLSIPDYPSEQTMTYIMLPADVRRMAQQMLEVAIASERTMDKKVRRYHREIEEERRKVLREAQVTTRCAEPDCKRQRHIFDENGVGWCKRHAEERGIRPTGKVT